jgi:hypothetical protein
MAKKASKKSGHQSTPTIPSSPDLASQPPSDFERGAADTDITRGKPLEGVPNRQPDSAVVAGDASSGGGAGAGVPGGGTDMRTDGAFDRVNPNDDRKKIFPNK